MSWTPEKSPETLWTCSPALCHLGMPWSGWSWSYQTAPSPRISFHWRSKLSLTAVWLPGSILQHVSSWCLRLREGKGLGPDLCSCGLKLLRWSHTSHAPLPKGRGGAKLTPTDRVKGDKSNQHAVQHACNDGNVYDSRHGGEIHCYCFESCSIFSELSKCFLKDSHNRAGIRRHRNSTDWWLQQSQWRTTGQVPQPRLEECML